MSKALYNKPIAVTEREEKALKKLRASLPIQTCLNHTERRAFDRLLSRLTRTRPIYVGYHLPRRV